MGGGNTGHNLQVLAAEADFSLSEQETHLLKRLTEIVIWAGRYQQPLSEKEYKDASVDNPRRLAPASDLNHVQQILARAKEKCLAAKKRLTLPSRGTSKGYRSWQPLMSNVRRHMKQHVVFVDVLVALRTGGIIEQNFRVTGGLRRVDVLNQQSLKIAREIKVGLTGLSPRVRQELARDVKLMRSGQVDEVNWHFFTSPITGKGGPTPALEAKLNQFGISVVGEN